MQEEPKTLGGRPQRIGRLYYDEKTDSLKICTGYCDYCKHKIGLTQKQLNELGRELPHGFGMFIARLIHTKILIPK